MCFSETASFTASGVLAIMSFFSLKAARAYPKYFPLALIPLFFAVQQFAEGLQWHFFNAGQTSLPSMATSRNVFAFFAYAWWPFWIPFSLLIAEEAYFRKIFLTAFTFLGFVFGAFSLYHIVSIPVKAEVVKNSIQYTAGVPYEIIFPYFLFTIAPWFISSLRGAAFLGTVIAISVAAGGYFYYDAFTSVWCFFSALISGLVIFVLKAQKRI